MKTKKNLAIVLSIIIICCLCIGISLNIGYAKEPLKDENASRLTNVTAMEMDGTIVQANSEAKIVGTDSMSSKARAISTMQIVNFNTKGAKTTNYTEYLTGESGYTCGAYGADAAYLGTSNGKVKFMLGGVVGLVDSSEVEVLSLSQVKSWSYYKVSNGKLYHYICTDMTTPGTASTLNNGIAPTYLKSGIEYYSYDGHYFYTNYNTMLKDYQNNVRTNSVNPNNPFYNYYQYLPLRSKTTYGASQLNSIISANTTSGSVMRNIGSYLTTAQNTYGVNALITASVAANESAWGQSNISKTKNNLFGLNAVDSSPGTSANTYGSIQACINDFANGWMSRGYLDPEDWRYYGAFLGDKASGINVKYASDPYWGEKAASIARILDADGGSIDENRYTIGIKDPIATDHYQYNLRQNANTSSAVPYQTGTASNYSFIILNKTAENGFYKVQSDGVLNASRNDVVSDKGEYDFDGMYAYMYADYVTIVNNGSTSIDTEIAFSKSFHIEPGKLAGFILYSNDRATVPKVYIKDNSIAKVEVRDSNDERGFTYNITGLNEGKTVIVAEQNGIRIEADVLVERLDISFSRPTENQEAGTTTGFLLYNNFREYSAQVYIENENIATVKLIDANDSRGLKYELTGLKKGETKLVAIVGDMKIEQVVSIQGPEMSFSKTINQKVGTLSQFLIYSDIRTSVPNVYLEDSDMGTVKVVNANDERGYKYEITGTKAGTTKLIAEMYGVKIEQEVTFEGPEMSFSKTINQKVGTLSQFLIYSDIRTSVPDVYLEDSDMGTVKVVNVNDERGYKYEITGTKAGTTKLIAEMYGVKIEQEVTFDGPEMSFSKTINQKVGTLSQFLIYSDIRTSVPDVYLEDSDMGTVKVVNVNDERGYKYEITGTKAGTTKLIAEMYGVKIEQVVTFQGPEMNFVGLNNCKAGSVYEFYIVSDLYDDNLIVYSENESIAVADIIETNDKGVKCRLTALNGGTVKVNAEMCGLKIEKNIDVQAEQIGFSRMLDGECGTTLGFIIYADNRVDIPDVYVENSNVAKVELVDAEDERGFKYQIELLNKGSTKVIARQNSVEVSIPLKVSKPPVIFSREISGTVGNTYGFLIYMEDRTVLPQVYVEDANIATVRLVDVNDIRGLKYEVIAKKSGKTSIIAELNGRKFQTSVDIISNGPLKGIDVSKYQGEIEWNKVKSDGIEFAFIRAGGRYGATGEIYDDPYFIENINGALENGIDVGVYFFTQAITEEEAIEEAKYTCSLLKNYKITYPVTIDTEALAGGRHNSISKEQRTKVVEAFCEEVQRQGYEPMIYANKNWLENNLNMNQLTRYKVWVAQYNTQCTYKGDYVCWQYTESGKVNGIKGGVDMNIWYS